MGAFRVTGSGQRGRGVLIFEAQGCRAFDKAVTWWGRSVIKSSYVSTEVKHRGEGQRDKEAIKADKGDKMAEKKGQREERKDR